MIEFKVASLVNNPNEGDFWQGLTAASVALQQAAQSEAAVYQVFSEQLVKLGLHGTVNLLDESGENLCITSMVFSDNLMRLINYAEKAVNIKSEEFVYPAHSSQADQVVLTKGDVVFLPDNTEKMQQVIPPRVFRFVAGLIKPFLEQPAILAPIFAHGEVTGVLYIAGKKLRVEDVPAIAAFATHLSIALENARLLQAVQQTESKYRRLFESANDGIFVFDQDTRRLLSANPKMLSLLEATEEELSFIRPSDRATPKIYELYKHHLEISLKNGHHFFDIPFIAKSGEERYWQISATLVELNGRQVLNGLVRDITEARRAEQALRQREEQFRVLAENVPGTIYLCKNEPGFPLIYINDGVEALTGHAKEKFIRWEINYNDLVHPDDLAQMSQVLTDEELADNRAFHYVYRIRHQTSGWRWAEDVGGGVFDELGNLLFLEGVISDITERVEADLLQKTVYRIAAAAHTNISLEELYHSIHESLALILNVENFYIALFDQASGKISVPYFVDKYDSCPADYDAGMGLTEFVVRSNSAQLLARPQIEYYAQQGVIKLKGTMPQVWLGVPLQAQGEAIGALAVQSYEESTAYSQQDKQLLTFVSDQISSVIERKQAEEKQRRLSAELMQQTRLLEAIFISTPDNFVVFDLDGRLLFASALILDYLNLAAEEVIGKTWQELKFPAEFGEISDKDRFIVLQTGQPVSREFEYVVNDTSREIELITNPLLDEENNIVSFVTTARDVTERRQTVRAMHRAQKMESLGVLAGGIAHDFNNLLVAMLGHASLALAHLGHEDPAYAHVNKMLRAAEQASGLTLQLLAYSGGGQFTIQTFQLNALIRESSELLKVALPKQVELAFDLAEELPLIEADKAQLQQVMMNLLINAAEAIGERPGTIWLRTAVNTVTVEDEIFWRYTDHPLLPGEYVSLCLEDNGQGMAEETIGKIFDPFFTTKFTGRGLGLAAVLGIVRGHQGGLRVESKPGSGTIFELLLPLSDKSESIDSERTDKIGQETAVSGVVLVIDDERAVREAVSDILEMEGIQVLAAGNGDAGIALYQKQASLIDLVLLDLSMPGKSGQETFKELEAFDPSVRIMLSSGYSEADATKGFSSPPLVGFLQKPYRLDEFVYRIQKYLHKENPDR